MAKATPQSVMSLSDKLHRRWTREFAGKPRHTRDLKELEHIIDKASVLAKKAKQLPGEKGDEVEKVVRERLALYVTERDAIADAQYTRPEVAEIHALGADIDRALAVWRRHYAGRDRRTRDLALLERTIASLARALQRLDALKEQPEVKADQLPNLFGQLEIMKDERNEIDKLRRQMSADDRAVSLLAEAQSALDRYRVLFAGQARTTGRVEVLDHIIASLERCRAGLAELDAEKHAANLAVIDQNIAGYKAERPQIAEANDKVGPRDKTNHLGVAANQMFGLYQQHFAGQERQSRDLKLLSDVCDRLTEVAIQMALHDKASAEAINRKNLPLVEERLRRYEAEWIEIAKVKAAIAEQQLKAGQTAQAAKGAQTAKGAQAGPQITIAPKREG